MSEAVHHWDCWHGRCTGEPPPSLPDIEGWKKFKRIIALLVNCPVLLKHSTLKYWHCRFPPPFDKMYILHKLLNIVTSLQLPLCSELGTALPTFERQFRSMAQMLDSTRHYIDTQQIGNHFPPRLDEPWITQPFQWLLHIRCFYSVIGPWIAIVVDHSVTVIRSLHEW